MTPPHPNILVAPLNWGLGHATRCIPIVHALAQSGFNPILASDGNALELLRKEFPHLQTLELPSYHIEYAKNGADFKWKMLANVPHIIDAMLAEKRLVKQWVKDYDLSGIISDNRLGVRSKKIPSVFLTHQLNVMTGNTTWLSSKMHRYIINQYVECWVPDFAKKPNLSGKLGHVKKPDDKIRYIGPLSRLRKLQVPKKFDLMVLLSGPEPQRGMLEGVLRDQLQDFDGEVVFISGKVDPKQKKEVIGRMTHYNFMATDQLELAMNASEKILCRPGYTTVMDLAKLGKKAFFIPTPGQYEQEYLARKLKRDGFAPYATQADFQLEQLAETDSFGGIPQMATDVHWKQLFSLFEDGFGN